MWSDMLIKLKEGKAFREFRGHLMNIPGDFDDEVERLNMHPDVLPFFKEDTQLSRSNNALLKRNYTWLE